MFTYYLLNILNLILSISKLSDTYYFGFVQTLNFVLQKLSAEGEIRTPSPVKDNCFQGRPFSPLRYLGIFINWGDGIRTHEVQESER